MKHNRNDEMLFDLFSRNRSVPRGMQARLDACYETIRQESGNTKPIQRAGRRGVKTALLIAAVVAVLSVSAVAAVEGNLFHLFGRLAVQYAGLGDHASFVTAEEAVVQDEYIQATGRIESVFYDGQSLALTYVISGDREYVEAWEPTAEELAEMEQVEGTYYPKALAPGETAAVEDLTAPQDGPYGYVRYSTYASDHTKTSDGVDIQPLGGPVYENENGDYCELREFVSPLPEEIQDLDEIELTIVLRHTAKYFYFDGENCYEKSELLSEELMTASAVRTEARDVVYTGSGEISGVAYTAEARFGLMQGTVTVTAEESIFTPEWFVVLYDEEGNCYLPARLTERTGNTDTLTFEYDGQGALPEALTAIPFAWPEDAEYFQDVEIDDAHGASLVKTE